MRLATRMNGFLKRYPHLEYSHLDTTLKHISRITKTSPDTLLVAAMTDLDCGRYLANLTLKLQGQSST
jgi:hypothetical protein